MATDTISTCTTADLRSWLDEKRSLVVIDTSIPEEFHRERIPGSQNACVFDVSFLDQVRELADVAGRQTPMVVYGSSPHSQASATAAEKLERAGYEAVYDYRGGLKEWKESGESTVGTLVAVDAPRVENRIYTVDPGLSVVRWVGRNFASEHHGTIAIESGNISVAGGSAVGEITLNMEEMENHDIEDPALRALLISHLKSDDFFDVGEYPEARVAIHAIEPQKGASPSGLTHQVRGALTLKGVTHEIEFPAQIGIGEMGMWIARANFDIDRTRWNVTYGSGKFYEKLGKHLVSDIITLDLKIVAH